MAVNFISCFIKIGGKKGKSLILVGLEIEKERPMVHGLYMDQSKWAMVHGLSIYQYYIFIWLNFFFFPNKILIFFYRGITQF